jgi:tRNA(adenine34) deaminase
MSKHKKFLDLAYKEALKAYEKGEVPIGAVVVKDGKVISKGHNLRISKKNPILHAEIVAIERAAKKLNNWRLDDCILYTTLEPCLMCTGAILQSRIKKVVFSAVDEKGGCVVSQYKIFEDNKLPFKVEYEIFKDERSSLLLKKFFKEKRQK